MKIRIGRICPPLLPVALLLAAGVGLGPFFADAQAGHIVQSIVLTDPARRLVALIAGAGLVVTWYLRPGSTGLWILCLAAPVWGALSMMQIHRPALPDSHISNFAGKKQTIISGTIVSFARQYPGKTAVTLACTAIEGTDGLPIPVTGQIRLNIYVPRGHNAIQIPEYGRHIRFFGRVYPIRNFANPGGYDFKSRMRCRKIFGAAHVKADKIRVLETMEKGVLDRFFRCAQRFRMQFKHRAGALARHGQSDAAGVLAALVTGNKDAVPMHVKEQFSKAGTSHLLAISGFHLSLLAFMFYFLLYTLLAGIHRMSVTGAAGKTAWMLTLIPVAAYALFTGFSPSTQRALIMAAALIWAFVAEKHKDGLNILCLAAIIILAIDPPALFSISFQLSFAAVLFIVIGFTWIYKQGWMPAHAVLAWLWSMVLVSVFAGLGTAPLIAHYFNLVSFAQIISNLILVPAIGFICLPLGITGFALDFIWPSAAAWVLCRTLDILEGCLVLAGWIADQDMAWMRVVTPDGTDLILIYLLLAGVFLAVTIRKKEALFFLGAVLTACAVSVCVHVKHRFYPGRLNVTVLDVGQANAAVVLTPEGHSILIDAGGFPGPAGFDTGRYIIGPYLWRRHIATLDAVFLTHPQADHMNGLVFIMENFTVKQWIRNGDENNSLTFGRLVDLARRGNIDQMIAGQTTQHLAFGRVVFDLMPAPSQENKPDLNNNSLVCRLRYHHFSMLFPGDIESERERWLVHQAKDLLLSRLMLAPHHGSQSSSTKIFLDQVHPQGVIISCGYKNRFGFPHPRVLDRYQRMGMNIFRTDLMGAVTIFSNGDDFEITADRRY